MTDVHTIAEIVIDGGSATEFRVSGTLQGGDAAVPADDSASAE